MSEAITAVFILIGAFFVLVGSLGMLRFPDFFTRLHGPTKATTLGLASLLAAFVAYAAGTESGVSVREFLITFFLFITAPVSAFMLGRSALRRRVDSVAPRPAAIDDDETEDDPA
ncbi:Na(+)/H(+) antiporter subunit G [wastewater metagenome]|uniref:Na(+)/H(+) antiporter subunit G n=2 Tax=unclassified sequences TaxID=12908 RepID=A0A5B8R8Q9_9ZZZZ|nr:MULTISPECIES: Na+/H+ antiporter subunit G [Arhodomonas]MCS4505737.1 Na+/H+ antiporter subunit G [Arhodomonas aquaeolei]QEA04328.1 Na(+)/H(+) antiporter subunit G [uncultured organism]